MSQSPSSTPKSKKADYDSPWKQALEEYFPLAMEFFFPEIATEIDWTQKFDCLSNELDILFPDSQTKDRRADVLVKVCQKDGTEAFVMVHSEVQAQKDTEFSRRMYVYNYRIFDYYNLPVVSLAILADPVKSWYSEPFEQSLWGCRVLLEFPTCKLLDYDQTQLENSINPFAIIVEAHLMAQKLGKNVEQKYTQQLSIAKSLYRRGFAPEDVVKLLRLVEWIVNLPKQLKLEIIREIKVFEGENNMPYISTFEEIAETKGLEQGRVEGRAEGETAIVLRLLNRQLGELDEDITNQITSLSIEQVEALADTLLDFEDRADLEQWLSNYVPDEDENPTQH